ncbi:MAG: ExbD/TolR family protein [Bacteroidota bacterium]|jgi:biopolymer transport protein ExbD|nr:biopolymer transporter ExbD [Saprospiraceae bacterium]
MGLKRRQRVEPEFSLAAMIDVIFLLLMFFMLTSNFVTPNALNLQLPSSSSKSMASSTFSVSVKADGTFYVERDPVAKEALENAIKAMIRKKTVGDDKSVTLTVSADKAAVIDNVVFILDIANRLKVKTILATNPPEKVDAQ